MFTGIVEEVGTVKRVHHVSNHAIQLTITANKITEDIHVGDSISVNGICLTVTDFAPTNFQVDVMPETMRATSLRSLTDNSKVNLERSMPANGRFGGHFVTGHVDDVGEILLKEQQENAVIYDILIPEEFTKFMIQKGSVAIDGISLTIFGVRENVIVLSLIPHTVQQTSLGSKNKGDIVNIECDLLAKHVHHMLQSK